MRRGQELAGDDLMIISDADEVREYIREWRGAMGGEGKARWGRQAGRQGGQGAIAESQKARETYVRSSRRLHTH